MNEQIKERNRQKLRRNLVKCSFIIFVIVGAFLLTSFDLVIPNTFTSGTTISSSAVNANFSSITNVINGNIDNTNLASDQGSLVKVSGGAMTSQSGNVGIGTTSPGSNLTLGSAGAGIIELPQTNGHYSGLIWKNPSYTKISAAIRAYSPTSYARQGLAFYTGDYSNTTTNAVARMVIMRNGNVGIGTTSPATKLHIDGGSDNNGTTGTMRIGGSAYMLFDSNEIDAAVNQQLYLNHNSSGNVVITTGGGMVGIGTTAPTYHFDLQKGHSTYIARFQNNSGLDGSDGIVVQIDDSSPSSSNNFIRFRKAGGTDIGTIRGSTSTTIAYQTSSDGRLKTGVTDLEGGLDLVLGMKPRSFEFISEPGHEYVGFIAQELMEVCPNAVGGDPEEDPHTDPMMVEYGRITPVLAAAIQDLNEIVERQQQEIDTLKEMNAALMERIIAIEEGLKTQ